MSPGFCSMLGLIFFWDGMHFLNAAKTRVCFFLFPWAKHLTQPFKPIYMLLALYNSCFILSDECSFSDHLPHCLLILFCSLLRLPECVVESKHSHMNFFGANTCSGSVSYTVFFSCILFLTMGSVCLCVHVLVSAQTHTLGHLCWVLQRSELQEAESHPVWVLRI